jgi:hypothetical protein
MSNTRSPAVISRMDRALISWDCERLIHLYAMLSDAGDMQAMASLFTRGASFAGLADPKTVIDGRDAILAAFLAQPPRFTRHLVTSVVITVQYPDRAIGHSYLSLHTGQTAQALAAAADPAHWIGAFQDRFAIEDGVWKFAERRGALSMSVGQRA